jgi:hypothetical protein
MGALWSSDPERKTDQQLELLKSIKEKRCRCEKANVIGF